MNLSQILKSTFFILACIGIYVWALLGRWDRESAVTIMLVAAFIYGETRADVKQQKIKKQDEIIRSLSNRLAKNHQTQTDGQTTT